MSETTGDRAQRLALHLAGADSGIPAGETSTRPEAVLLDMATVNPERVQWLWPGRIPLGKLTLWCGDPNLGKSMTTMDIVARVTTGARWPDDRAGTCREPASAIILSAEDDAADTIRPRLDAAGADVSRVACLTGVNCGDGEQFFDLSTDLAALEGAIQRLADVRLIIIDPISAYMGTKLDSHRNTDVRAILAPLGTMAARHRIAVLAVTHLSKGAGGKAIYRATGSLAFIAAARGSWLIAEDPVDPEHRLLLSMKLNVGKPAPSWGYKIRSDDEGRPIVAWDGSANSMTAGAIMAAELDRPDKELDKAIGFLQELLANGPVPKSTVDAEARGAGYSAATIKRAKATLGVHAKKDGMEGGWLWYLPEGAQPQGNDFEPLRRCSSFLELERLRLAGLKRRFFMARATYPLKGLNGKPLELRPFGWRCRKLGRERPKKRG